MHAALAALDQDDLELRLLLVRRHCQATSAREDAAVSRLQAEGLLPGGDVPALVWECVSSLEAMLLEARRRRGSISIISI